MLSPQKARNLLRRLPVKVLAKRLGVSASTITRYRKQGKVPDSRRPALDSLASSELDVRPDSRKLKKALVLDAKVLASFAGVSVATARKWKKEGAIPKRSQGFLVEREKEPAPRKFKTKVETYVGKITRGRIYTTGINAIMSNQLELMIASWVSAQRRSPNKRANYQLVAKGRTFIDPKTETVGSAKVFFPGGDIHYGEVDMTFAGFNARTPKGALVSFLRLLEENYHLVVYLSSLTLFIRTPK